MSQSLPTRNRQNLRLALAQLNGSPRPSGQFTPLAGSLSVPNQSPAETPFGKTSYSPFRSAHLKPLSPYGSPVAFAPRSSDRTYYGKFYWFRIKRALSSKPIWLFLMAVVLLTWWFNGGSDELDLVNFSASGLGKELLQEMKMHDYQFFPATNPKIHYVGRWTSTPNRLRKDGTFPGVYFDITIKNTTTLLVALNNAPEPVRDTTAASSQISPAITRSPGHRHFHIHPIASSENTAPPVSLLARVDDQEYVLLPNSTSLVTIRSEDLDPSTEHNVRIVAPMIDDCGKGVVELNGLWLNKGGQLVKVAGSLLSEEYANEDQLRAEDSPVGEPHRQGLIEVEKGAKIEGDVHSENDGDNDISGYRKRVLEVVTDSPGSFIGKQRGARTGGADGLMAGVMGWEYLLGEMFDADHIGIGVDGMCLTQDCIGGRGQPAGLGDVFFRSGPYGSQYFDSSWMFSAYVPDVLILNVGEADSTSFHEFSTSYNKTLWDLTATFESTYVSLINGVRDLAYPKHPNIVQSERAGRPGVISGSGAATIPIFIMRPLRGQLEQATQNIVAKLRGDGDKSVFWLDTSGWLDLNIEDGEGADFYLDETVTPAKHRLTERGNQRVAVFLHIHVCRYLAEAEDNCPFLPPEVYQGKVFNEEEARFDKYVEDEKERKLKKLFWESEESLVKVAIE
ncbi:hypothetical protein ACLMJK_000943 [Lecanora helva]